MAERIPEEEQSNYETFRDCLSEPVLRTLAAPVETVKRKKKHRKGRSSVGKREMEVTTVERLEEDGSAAEDLGEFIDVRQSSMFFIKSIDRNSVPLERHLPLLTDRHKNAQPHQVPRFVAPPRSLLHPSLGFYIHVAD